MNCQDCHETIGTLVDCETSDAESSALYAHLAGCAACRNYMMQTLRLRESIRGVQPHGYPASLDARILPGGSVVAPQAPDRPAALPSARQKGVRAGMRRKISLPLSVVLITVIASILASAYVTSTYFPKHEIIEKKEKELVYIMELPEVEIKGSAVGENDVR